MISHDNKLYVKITEYVYIITIGKNGPINKILLNISDIVSIIYEGISIEPINEKHWDTIYSFIIQERILDPDNEKLKKVIENLKPIINSQLLKKHSEAVEKIGRLINKENSNTKSNPFLSNNFIAPLHNSTKKSTNSISSLIKLKKPDKKIKVKDNINAGDIIDNFNVIEFTK